MTLLRQCQARSQRRCILYLLCPSIHYGAVLRQAAQRLIRLLATSVSPGTPAPSIVYAMIQQPMVASQPASVEKALSTDTLARQPETAASFHALGALLAGSGFAGGGVEGIDLKMVPIPQARRELHAPQVLLGIRSAGPSG